MTRGLTLSFLEHAKLKETRNETRAVGFRREVPNPGFRFLRGPVDEGWGKGQGDGVVTVQQ
jgi:hypothetical protein